RRLGRRPHPRGLRGGAADLPGLHGPAAGDGSEVRRVLPLAPLFAARPAWAHRTGLTGLGGDSTPGDSGKKAPPFQELAIDAGFTWGVAAGHFFTPHIGVEASWVRQESGLKFAASAGSETLFDVNVDQVQASFAYRFGSDGARMRPFLSAGL